MRYESAMRKSEESVELIQEDQRLAPSRKQNDSRRSVL